jgi:curved DNA-binding protein CbpA
VTDEYFREILGISEGASREQIRSAYRLRVMENHPDRFPVDQKARQELATIKLNEAYHALMRSDPGSPEGPTRRPTSRRAGASAQRATHAPAAPRGALARHRDPGYAYYKQGFINYSLAVHGIADVNQRIAAGRIPALSRRYTATEYFGGSLAFLRAAHGYFTRVVEDHPASVWAADAKWKLYRIEQYTRLYRRILRNITGEGAPG